MRWILCLLGSHQWKIAGHGLPNSCSPGKDYFTCARCGKDSREAWEIQDDTCCRMEHIRLLLHDPHHWDPREKHERVER